jgi:hypothetical protein
VRAPVSACARLHCNLLHCTLQRVRCTIVRCMRSMSRLRLRRRATTLLTLSRRRRPMGRERSRASCRRRSRGTRRSTRCCCRGTCEPPARPLPTLPVALHVVRCIVPPAARCTSSAAHHPSHARIHYDVACCASSVALRAAPSRSALHLSTARGTHGVLTGYPRGTHAAAPVRQHRRMQAHAALRVRPRLRRRRAGGRVDVPRVRRRGRRGL